MAKKSFPNNFSNFIPIITFFLLIGLGVLWLFGINNQRSQSFLIDPLVAKYSPPDVKIPKGSPHFVLPPTKTLSRLKSLRIPILMYHYIEYNKDKGDTLRTGLSVTPFNFSKQLETLKENGYTVIDFRELKTILKGEEEIPNKPILLTFDDGYRDFYTDAFPVLKKFNMKATNFIITNHIGRSGNLTEEMIKELLKSGLITIGAHTKNHINLTRVSDSEAWSEIKGSKEKLEKTFGIKILDFAYPYGFFNEAAISLVKKSGYDTASSTILGSIQNTDNIFRLNRIRVGNYYGKTFVDKIEKAGKIK